jgi:F-type H+-transporting ATPase subunit a
VTTGPGGTPAEFDEQREDQRAPGAPARRRRRAGARFFVLLGLAVLALDLVAANVVPPFPAGGEPGQACDFPACYVQSAIEMPPPEVVLDFQPATAPATAPMFYFHPSISSTILTMWLVMALLLIFAIAATRRMRLRPGRVQNAVEWAYTFGQEFTAGVGGDQAKPYYPIFAAFFVLILFCNWSGLVPPIGKIPELRAPTSDVNVTIGLAAVSFAIFVGEGVHRLGLRGYLGKFFPLGEFRRGLGNGLLGMYVGIIELFLELVKPVVLAMRLFGNIYGGEVALAVISALTLAVIPVALMGLELLLNLIQALIFSILTLVFIMMAIEGHSSEGHERAADHGEASVSGPVDLTSQTAA